MARSVPLVGPGGSVVIYGYPVITPPAAAPTAAAAKAKPGKRRWAAASRCAGLVLLFWAVTLHPARAERPDLSDAVHVLPGRATR